MSFYAGVVGIDLGATAQEIVPLLKGRWVGWVEEKEAVGMRYCELGVGRLRM